MENAHKNAIMRPNLSSPTENIIKTRCSASYKEFVRLIFIATLFSFIIATSREVHTFGIETGRHNTIDRELRICRIYCFQKLKEKYC